MELKVEDFDMFGLGITVTHETLVELSSKVDSVSSLQGQILLETMGDTEVIVKGYHSQEDPERAFRVRLIARGSWVDNISRPGKHDNTVLRFALLEDTFCVNVPSELLYALFERMDYNAIPTGRLEISHRFERLSDDIRLYLQGRYVGDRTGGTNRIRLIAETPYHEVKAQDSSP